MPGYRLRGWTELFIFTFSKPQPLNYGERDDQGTGKCWFRISGLISNISGISIPPFCCVPAVKCRDWFRRMFPLPIIRVKLTFGVGKPTLHIEDLPGGSNILVNIVR